MNTYDYSYYFPDGSCSGTTVFEKEEVQLTKLLGPDGEPYAIKRNKRRVGFELHKKESNH